MSLAENTPMPPRRGPWKAFGLLAIVFVSLAWLLLGGLDGLMEQYPDVSWPTVILFSMFLLCFLLTIPVGIALGVATLAAIASSDLMNFSTIIRSLYQGANSFPLMAVPFFVLAGTFMSSGGVSKRLLNLASVGFGRMTGGLALVTIAACLFFGAISGSAAATVAAIGVLMVPDMVKLGYGRPFSSALIASAGSLGAIIPPSLSMIIYGVATNASIPELFMGGIVPGLLLGIGMMVYAYFHSKKKGYVGSDRVYTRREKFEIFWDAKWAILVPVIILGGIYGGVFTPTEAAVIAVVYGWIIGVFVYKEISFRSLPRDLLESAAVTAVLLVIIGTSNAFGQVLTIEQVPTKIAGLITSISDNPLIILLMINILLLIVGTFMETLAAIIILAPMLLGLVRVLGLDPVHFGLIMCVNLAIGYITPPLGANLFVASSVTGTSFSDICRSIGPFILTMIVILMVLTYVPQLTMFLPMYFMRGMPFSEAISF